MAWLIMALCFVGGFLSGGAFIVWWILYSLDCENARTKNEASKRRTEHEYWNINRVDPE